MKKIIIGKGLEEVVCQCSFCGESNKECVRGSISFVASYDKPILSEYGLYAKLSVSRHYRVGFLSGCYYKIPEREEKYGYIWDGESTKKVEERNSADICKDCIRQLAKLIK